MDPLDRPPPRPPPLRAPAPAARPSAAAILPEIRLPRIERSSIRREALAVPHMYRARSAAWAEMVTPARM